MFDGIPLDDFSDFESRVEDSVAALESSTRLFFNVLSAMERPEGDGMVNPAESVARSIESLGRELHDEFVYAARAGMTARAERLAAQAEECFACARTLRETPPE